MLSLRSKAFKASVVHVDVRRVQETQVLGQEEGCSHIERHDSWMNQVCCVSMRPRPRARRISPRSSRDKEAFARAFGVVAPKAMPFRSYAIFLTRDTMAMGFIFTLPPVLSPLIQEKAGLSKPTAEFASSFCTPVLSQVFTTPFHLLGLSIYNHDSASMAKHLAGLKETYPPTVLLRMLRIIPAFSVGGVANRYVRTEWHARAEAPS